MAENDDVLTQASSWLESGKRVSLATVVSTWGSSPRPAGSMLGVSDEGKFVGSVSGGCIEGAVIDEGLAVMKDGKPRLLDFGVTDEMAWEVGLACGGEMKVYVEQAPEAAILKNLLARRPIALVTETTTGAISLVGLDSAEGALALSDDTLAQTRAALRGDRSITIDAEAGKLLVRAFNPPLRMLIVGAVHIAQTLAPMAQLSGFDVTVVDPRAAFATPERFPGTPLEPHWPDEVMAKLAPDLRTAVVTLVHDPKIDDPALEAALASEAFYVGALGSRGTHAKRVERLKEKGFTDDQISRIHAPVGLPLGGRKTPEIAVAILAEAIAAIHAKGAG
jgi:xanthine dehydrogenase accessory factor